MASDRLVQVLRHIARRGIELDNRAVALVTAHYRQLSLDGLTELLDQAAAIDSSARRVGYAQAILDQFDTLAGRLGAVPPGLNDLLRDATRLGMAATAELVDAQTGLAFDLPARRELQYLRRSQERFQQFWNKEPVRFRQDVQDVLTTGLQRGQRPADIMTALQARQRVSRSRAALIVRNETGNAQAYAMQTDQRAMGFRQYTWSTARDRRVRPLHRAREGRVYDWSNPPGDGAPGEAIMCRCAAIPFTDVSPLPAPVRVVPQPLVPVVTPPTPPAPAAPPVPPRGPLGRPVGDALTLDPAEKRLDVARDAIAAIGRVHGDGTLPTLPLQIDKLGPSTNGAYIFNQMTTNPVRIVLTSTKSRRSQLTTVHEIGHFLDHHGLGSPGRWTSSNRELPEMVNVLDTIRASGAVTTLRQRRVAGSWGGERMDLKHITYLLTPEELWARAYAQFIAVEDGNGTMLTELQERRTGLYGQLYLTQWEDADFEPIRDAIRTMFRARGWMT